MPLSADFAESINTSFIDQVKDYAVFAMYKDGTIATWNRGAERIKGYREEEVIGQFYGMLFPDEYQQAGRPLEELNQALENGSYEAEDWRKRKDGSFFWAKVTLTPIYSKEGEHIGFTKVTGDGSKQKELQEKLAERNDVLNEKNKELLKINLDLDNFIYTASHDLRSPISNIEGLMMVLRHELSNTQCLSSKADDMLQRVMSSINRFKRTIEDLTEISRLQKNISIGLAEEIINIAEVYEDVMADLDQPNGLKADFIRTDFKVHQLKFSRKNFRSILYNLISNAIKYQAPDRDCIIEIESCLEGSFVKLSIKDNGLGIDERSQKQLFTIFRRFHDHVDGTGIGLFMVKRIVENAGGKIEVESKEGVGTEFRIYLSADL